MAQVTVACLPIACCGVAHLRWGPVCQAKGSEVDRSIVENMARALYHEYVARRGLLLRVIPKAYAGTPRGNCFASAFAQFRTGRFGAAESYRTLDVDLASPLDIVRKRLDQKWRNQLNRAERNGLVVREDSTSAWLPRFAELLATTRARKGFAPGSDVREFATMQQYLRDHERLKVMLCEANRVVIAGLVGCAMGDTGIYLFGATTEDGLRAKAAYLLQWRMIEWLKAIGVTHYDLGGINPKRNPGVYHFKRGLAGADSLYARPLLACANPRSTLFSGVLATLGTPVGRTLKRAIHAWQR